MRKLEENLSTKGSVCVLGFPKKKIWENSEGIVADLFYSSNFLPSFYKVSTKFLFFALLFVIKNQNAKKKDRSEERSPQIEFGN
jgi:hypothetical protein